MVQDEGILNVESDIETVGATIVDIDNNISDLQESDLKLNLSIAELETRINDVETLNVTVTGILVSVENLGQTDIELNLEMEYVLT